MLFRGVLPPSAEQFIARKLIFNNAFSALLGVQVKVSSLAKSRKIAAVNVGLKRKLKASSHRKST
jgi:hypothetical protein